MLIDGVKMALPNIVPGWLSSCTVCLQSEVVMTTDLEALLTEHAHELDNHLDKLKADLMSVLEVN